MKRRTLFGWTGVLTLFPRELTALGKILVDFICYQKAALLQYTYELKSRSQNPFFLPHLVSNVLNVDF
jgi:hypothetical protein